MVLATEINTKSSDRIRIILSAVTDNGKATKARTKSMTSSGEQQNEANSHKW